MSTAKPVEAQVAAPTSALGEEPKKSPLRLYALIGVITLAALGGGLWFFAPGLLGVRADHVKAPVEEPVKVTVPLGAVVVNLTGEPRRYLRASVHLGVASAKDAKEIEETKSQLVDLVIGVLSNADAEALLSEDGRGGLKDELLTRIRDELHLTKVARIYFTEFVIQ